MLFCRILFLIINILLILISFTLKAKEKVIYFSTPESCPFVCDESKGLGRGFIIDILSDIYKEINVEVKVVIAVDMRTIMLMKKDETDMFVVSSSSDTDSLNNYSLSKKVIFTSKTGVVHKKNNQKYKTMADIIPLRIPIERKHHLKGDIGEFYRQKEQNSSWVFISGWNNGRIAQLLSYNRIDAALIDVEDFQFLFHTDDSVTFQVINDFPIINNYLVFSNRLVEKGWFKHYEQRIGHYSSPELRIKYLAKYLLEK